MNYEYILNIDFIDNKILHVIEFEKGKINGKRWTINEIKNYKMIQNYSLTRTKEWLYDNYPEFLI
jgi:hypothetical protein